MRWVNAAASSSQPHSGSLSLQKHIMASQLKLAKFWGKRRANSSNVWDHFGLQSDEKGIIIDKTKAVCKYCEAEVKYVGGSTSNLTSHCNNHHVGQPRNEELVSNLQSSQHLLPVRSTQGVAVITSCWRGE